jgi:hypothetical protein
MIPIAIIAKSPIVDISGTFSCSISVQSFEISLHVCPGGHGGVPGLQLPKPLHVSVPLQNIPSLHEVPDCAKMF